MRVVVITGTAPHHQQFCATLHQTGMVVGIIHPKVSQLGFLRRIKVEYRLARKHGGALALLRLLGRVHSLISSRVHKEATQDEMVVSYDRIPRSIIHRQCDVQSTVTVDLLRSLQPEVTICLGGPVYPKAMIEASPLTLNFHSGISPLYNGAASIRFAFANGHPQLCGGTLMVMGAKVDGGGILGHYLPEIRAGDSPAVLFDRIVHGAGIMYVNILSHLAKGHTLPGHIVQPRPLFYYRGYEFGWTQEIMLRRNMREDICAHYTQTEVFLEYWREASLKAMQKACRATLERLLWKSVTAD